MTGAKKTLRSDAKRLLADCPGWSSRLAARRIAQFMDAEMRASGLSAAQTGLLSLIAAADDDTHAALAARAGLDPSTFSRNLRTLEARGLIEIATVEEDLRRRAVWLTESGARRLAAAIPLWRRAQAKFSRMIDAGIAIRLAQKTAAL